MNDDISIIRKWSQSFSTRKRRWPFSDSTLRSLDLHAAFFPSWQGDEWDIRSLNIPQLLATACLSAGPIHLPSEQIYETCRDCRVLSHCFHNYVAAGPLCDRGLHHSGVHHGTSPESTFHPGVNIVNGKVFMNHFIPDSNTDFIRNFRHCMQQLVLGSCSQHFSSNLSFPP